MWTLALWVFPLLCKCSLAALPAKPENISCILYFNKNMTCTWSPEEETRDTNYTVRLTYSFGKSNYTAYATRALCSFSPPCVLPPDNCSVEVEAQNGDGKSKSDITYWDLDHIVKTEPPIISSVNPISNQMFQIWWRPRENLRVYHLKCILRFRTVNSTHWMEVSFEDHDLVYKNHNLVYNLTGLQAFTEYVIALRFRINESRFWSHWSKEETGVTMEEVPHVLDLWRVLGPTDANGMRKVLLLWKKARGAPVLERTLGYNIQYFPENSTILTEINNVTNQQYELLLMGQSYRVSVTSFNSLGKSQEAVLRIPAVGEDTIQCISDMEDYLTEPLLVLKWQSSVPEVDTWLVEWFPETVQSKFSGLSWESVSRVTNWTIERDKLKPLVCYNISVYPVLGQQVGEPYTIQVYAREDAPSKGPKTWAENIGLKTATIIWEEIPKSERNGFINNYTLFYQAEGGKIFSKTVSAGVLQYDLESLTRRTSYTVWVEANTRAGGKSGDTINFRTLSISIFEIICLSSLVGGGLLLFSIFAVTSALKKPNRLTRLCCPDVPNPAESSLATWIGDNFKGKSSPKESENSGNTEGRVLKPCSVPTDLVDKLMVNFETFLEVVSTEEARKGQESILGGEENEYVTSPSRPDCPPGKSFKEPPVLTEAAPGEAYNQCLGTTEETYTEFNEQLLSSGHSPEREPLCEERAPNPYLKNSVTTREFLIPEHTKREI
ncbi:interleukin-31 receptor subunit alpha isoform X2 [Peromyscus californicus insignis]|uniref:interleukin-31 receptor subunit alpha isoform X2 n=1 Tax=Peromyscus californicus insignis TaxID=564181 RepID=UPI0022A662D5|nr:interleukin-31 receptor subunit alpha isoform X2 [Peromyscus californicus insignis]